MKNRKTFWRKAALLAFCLILITGLMGCFGGSSGGSQLPSPGADDQLSEGHVRVHFIDVGQGDSILIQTQDKTVLIDGGDVPAGDGLVKYLHNQGVRQIDYLVVTHPHSDHYGGLLKVLGEFPVKQVYDSGQVTAANLFKQYLSIIRDQKIPFEIVAPGKELSLGKNIRLTFLHPGKPLINDTESDLNNNSVVAKLQVNAVSFLLPGDIQTEGEERLLKSGIDLKSTFLKVAHHGSHSSSSAQFLRAVQPQVGVIMCGKDNPYHHPHQEALERLQQAGVKLYRTDLSGSIVVDTDGINYQVRTEKAPQ